MDRRLDVARRLPGEGKGGVAEGSSYGVVCGQSQVQHFGVSINVLPILQIRRSCVNAAYNAGAAVVPACFLLISLTPDIFCHCDRSASLLCMLQDIRQANQLLCEYELRLQMAV